MNQADFSEDLGGPLHRPGLWRPRRAGRDEVPVAGLRMETRFPDQAGVLKSAYADFEEFLLARGIRKGGRFALATRSAPMDEPEGYRIEVKEDECRLSSGDCEGIRRGLVHIEDLMRRAGGPFLPRGVIERRPWVKTRIARSVYAPVNRPPANRDELLDDRDYYPPGYLNRLAHHAVNGIWVGLRFRDIMPTGLFPGSGKDAGRRLDKLRRLTRECARYGIKVYPLCLEPAALSRDWTAREECPDPRGHTWSSVSMFCTESRAGQAYLRQAVRTLFSAVSGLGGLIVLCVGERPTHCWSGRAGRGAPQNCPRCRGRAPGAVVARMFSVMRDALSLEAPSAELIAWPYSQYLLWDRRESLSFASRLPAGVALMHNFESGGRLKLGRGWWRADDYWLSYPGPSGFFRACARTARQRGARVFAKLQVACSHEVATVPYVPAPGLLYDKYRAMRALGVSGAVECWFFGGWPSPMTKAAGELSFEPFPLSKRSFLEQLARMDWGSDGPAAARAWRFFEEGYRRCPPYIGFSFHGPMHDGVRWPLHLEPKDIPLAPSWAPAHWNERRDRGPGDRIGECLPARHSIGEVLDLCRFMERRWRKGVAGLVSLRKKYREDDDRRKDIGVAEALGCHFRSGLHILEFYYLREKLTALAGQPALEMLARMKRIVRAEESVRRTILGLAVADRRLGFHSELECHRYDPASIRLGMRSLARTLTGEFRRVEERIRRGRQAFPCSRRGGKTVKTYPCRRIAVAPGLSERPDGGVWEQLVVGGGFSRWEDGGTPRRQTTWKACRTDDRLFFGITCDGRALDDCVRVAIETDRFRCFTAVFEVRADGRRSRFYVDREDLVPRGAWRARVITDGRRWHVVMSIPFKLIGVRPSLGNMLRMNVGRRGGCGVNREETAWAPARFGRSDLGAADFGLCVWE